MARLGGFQRCQGPGPIKFDIEIRILARRFDKIQYPCDIDLTLTQRAVAGSVPVFHMHVLEYRQERPHVGSLRILFEAE